MIEVRVGMNDGFNLQRLFVECFNNLWNLVAGIDDDSFAGFKVCNDGTVTLEPANGKCRSPKAHASMLPPAACSVNP